MLLAASESAVTKKQVALDDAALVLNATVRVLTLD
jgi:hypothetical protein